MDTLDIFYLVVIFHLFIIIFGRDEYRPTSIVIALAAAINIVLVDITSVLEHMDYIQKREFWIWYNGCTAMLLCLLPHSIKFTIRHAIILIFACLCHLGIIWELTRTSNFASYFIYDYYEVLIITVGILQMWISLDGFTGAFIRLRDFIRDIVFRRVRCHQNFISFKGRKGKA